MTRLVFHLGDKKTGSTAIQTVLASGLWTCSSVGLSYPTNGRISHILLARGLQRGAASPAAVAVRFREISQELQSKPSDVAVISAEDFEDVDPLVLRKAILQHLPAYLDTAKFIAYVRPHADRLVSSFSERVKAGGQVTSMDELYDRFRQAGTLNYARRFQKWRSAFGGQFVLRPLARDLLFKADVVQDFLRFALGTDDFSAANPPNANKSLTLENLALLKEMLAWLRPANGRRNELQTAFGRYVGRLMANSPLEGTKLQIHRSLAERVLADFETDARELDREFFDGTPMFDTLNAAPAKAIDQAQSLRLEDHYSEREQFLIRMWITQTATFLKADPDLWAKMLRADQLKWIKGAVSGPGRPESKAAKAGARTEKHGKASVAPATGNPAGARKALKALAAKTET